MKQTDHPAPAPTTTQPKPQAMSVHTFFLLNGGLLLVSGALYLLMDSSAFWEIVVSFAGVLLLGFVANGFLFFKALWRREYLLAIGYLLVVVGAVVLFSALPTYSKTGG
jgi:uncharacterized membrane protein